MKPILCLPLAQVAVAPVWAVDTEPDPAPKAVAAPDRVATARGHLAARRWADALAELKRVNGTGNADWNNLTGYVLRKSPAPDLAAAECAYDAALRIAPDHRGALEYSGEPYLMKGELAKAEQRAAQIARARAPACEEHADLKKAVDRYKAAGNKFVAAP
jgi:hypothetical protein